MAKVPTGGHGLHPSQGLLIHMFLWVVYNVHLNDRLTLHVSDLSMKQ